MFIKLTNDVDDKPIWVNTDTIEVIEEYQGIMHISLSSGNYRKVKQSVDEVVTGKAENEKR